MSDFLFRHAVRDAGAATTAATTTVNGTIIDTAGYDGVVFVTRIPTAAAGNFLKAQQGKVSNLSDAADLAGSKVVADADASLVAVAVHKPNKRYVRPSIVRGTSTATESILAILYRGRKQPGVNTIANTLKTVSLTEPAEGTP